MNCPNCNAPISPEALFCPACGTKAEPGEAADPVPSDDTARFLPNVLAREAAKLAWSVIVVSAVALLTVAARGYPAGSDIFLFVACCLWAGVGVLFLWVAFWLAARDVSRDCAKWGFRIVVLQTVSLFYMGPVLALATAGVEVESFGVLDLLGALFAVGFFAVAAKSGDRRMSRLSKYVLAAGIVDCAGSLAGWTLFAFAATAIEAWGLSRVLSEPDR